MRARRAAGAIVISVELSPVGVEAPVRCGLLDIARRSQASAVREAFRIFVEREFAKVTKSLDSSDRDLTRDEILQRTDIIGVSGRARAPILRGWRLIFKITQADFANA